MARSDSNIAHENTTAGDELAMARSDSNIAHENTTAGPGAIVTLRMISYGQER